MHADCDGNYDLVRIQQFSIQLNKKCQQTEPKTYWK